MLSGADWIMHKKPNDKVYKILGLSLTFNQLIELLILAAVSVFLIFNVSLTINTKFFSASVTPANIKTNHVNINHNK